MLPPRPQSISARGHAMAQRRPGQVRLKALKNPQLLDTQVIQAQAARLAQRALAQVQAGNRPEDIAAVRGGTLLSKADLQSNKDRLWPRRQAERRAQQRRWLTQGVARCPGHQATGRMSRIRQ
jgi:hypothetical protein